MKKYKVITICGKAGSGKDTLLKELIARYPDTYNKIISFTTRPPREKEVHGVDYYFLDKKEFKRQAFNGKLLEFTNFNGWYYGTSIYTLKQDKINIGIFNPSGILSLQNKEDIDLTVYYLQVPAKYRLIRQLNREENPDVKEIIRRFSADEKDFEKLNDIQYIELRNDNRDFIPFNIKLITGLE